VLSYQILTTNLIFSKDHTGATEYFINLNFNLKLKLSVAKGGEQMILSTRWTFST